MEPILLLGLVGGIGGLVTSANWYLENKESGQKINPVLVLRNFILGVFGAVSAVTMTNPDVFPPVLTPVLVLLSFTSGLAGEFILQKGTKAITG